MFDGLAPALRNAVPARLELDALDPINRGLLGFWPLNEPGGSIADDISPYRSRGTLVGAPSRIVGARGRATNFNGSSQYITTSRRQEIPGGFSASAWINVATGFDRVILSSIYSTDNTILWRVTSNGTQFDFWANTGVAQATASGLTAFADRWICAGVSWAPGRATRFYINGVDVGGGTTSGDIQSPISAWHIGRYGYPGIWYFNGSIRMVRTWGRVLPVRDFKRLYEEPYAGTFDPADRLFFAAKPPAAPTAINIPILGLFDPGLVPVAWFSPQISPMGWFAPELVAEISGSDVSADLAVTLGAVTSSAAGTLPIQGELSGTLGEVTSSAAGALPIVGAAGVTLGAVTLSASGAIAIQGAASVALGAVAVSSAAVLPIQAAASVTLGAVTVAGAGTLPIAASLAKTLGTVTLSSAGVLPVVGAVAATLGAVTLSADGTLGGGVSIAGELAVTLGAVTLTAAGSLPIVAAAANTLGAVTLSAAGALAVQGQASVTLGAVVSSAAGVLPIQAVASLPLGAVTVVSAAVLALQGSAAITLGAVTSSAAGVLALTGDLSAVLGAVSLESGGYHGSIAASASRTVVLPARSRSVTPMARDRGIASPARDRAAVVADRARGLALPARDRTFSPEDRT